MELDVQSEPLLPQQQTTEPERNYQSFYFRWLTFFFASSQKNWMGLVISIGKCLLYFGVFMMCIVFFTAHPQIRGVHLYSFPSSTTPVGAEIITVISLTVLAVLVHIFGTLTFCNNEGLHRVFQILSPKDIETMLNLHGLGVVAMSLLASAIVEVFFILEMGAPHDAVSLGVVVAILVEMYFAAFFNALLIFSMIDVLFLIFHVFSQALIRYQEKLEGNNFALRDFIAQHKEIREQLNAICLEWRWRLIFGVTIGLVVIMMVCCFV